MKAAINRALTSIVLRIFNRVFRSSVDIDDIASIRLLARDNLRLREEDVESVRILLNEGLRFDARDVHTIRLVVREGLHLDEDEIRIIRTLLDERLGAQLCYSQEGESLILDRLFQSRTKGSYVDVGAHHPKRFSNTYALYKKGWRGINIDPTPGVKELFEAARPQDLFVAAAVSSDESVRDFYMFNESALNTFNKTLADQYEQAGYKVAEVRPVKSSKLCTLLEACNVEDLIDLMSIDVEGQELDVLQSNDWKKHRPHVLLVEIIDFDLSRPDASPVHNYIVDRGYVLLAKTFNTVFYRDGSASNRRQSP